MVRKENEFDVLMFNASIKDSKRREAEKRLAKQKKKLMWRKVLSYVKIL